MALASLPVMTVDFTSYEFTEGITYSIEVDDGVEAVRVEHHGEGAPEPQTTYESIEYLGAVGSGPWRRFRDWASETDLSINTHSITDVRTTD